MNDLIPRPTFTPEDCVLVILPGNRHIWCNCPMHRAMHEQAQTRQVLTLAHLGL